MLLLLGLWLVLRKFEKTPRLTREQIAGLIVLFVVALISMGFIDRAAAGSIGTGLLGALTGALGQIGSVVLLAVGWLIAIVLLFDVTPSEIATRIARGLRRIKPAHCAPAINGRGWVEHDDTAGDSTRPAGRCGDQHRPIEWQWRQGRPATIDRSVPAPTAAPAPEQPAPQASRYAVTPRARPDAPPPGMLGDQTMAKPLAIRRRASRRTGSITHRPVVPAHHRPAAAVGMPAGRRYF